MNKLLTIFTKKESNLTEIEKKIDHYIAEKQKGGPFDQAKANILQAFKASVKEPNIDVHAAAMAANELNRQCEKDKDEIKKAAKQTIKNFEKADTQAKENLNKIDYSYETCKKDIVDKMSFYEISYGLIPVKTQTNRDSQIYKLLLEYYNTVEPVSDNKLIL
jgi:DNA polymerase III delta prime subunit